MFARNVVSTHPVPARTFLVKTRSEIMFRSNMMRFSMSKIPAVVFLVLVGVAVSLVMSQVAFGEQNPPGCNTNSVAISLAARAGGVTTTGPVYHGDSITYQITLSTGGVGVGQIKCAYDGGQLSITLPSGDIVELAGFGGSTPDVPLIGDGSSFTIDSPVDYSVGHADETSFLLAAVADYGSTTNRPLQEAGTFHAVTDQKSVNASTSNKMLVIHPGTRVGISASETQVTPGTDVEIIFSEFNTGDVPLTAPFVQLDSAGGNHDSTSATFTGGDTNSDSVLDVGEMWQWKVTFRIASDATFVATGHGTDPLGQDITSPAFPSERASIDVDVINPSLSVNVTTDARQVVVGTNVIYTVLVTNTGDVQLTGVELDSSVVSSCARDFAILSSGAATDYQCSGVANADLTNIVTGRAADPTGGTVEASDRVSVDVIQPALNIDISPDSQQVVEGQSASFKITVTNGGDVTLTDVDVSDSVVPSCANVIPNLSASESFQYTCSFRVTANITNIVATSAQTPIGRTVTVSDSAVVQVINPSTSVSIEASKTQVIVVMVKTLTIKERNSGNVEITNPFVVVDPLGITLTRISQEYHSGDKDDDGVLDVGETWEWRVITTTQAENQTLASVTYVATGHGLDPLGNDVTFPGVLTE